jgi:hypothetical protein
VWLCAFNFFNEFIPFFILANSNLSGFFLL